MNLEKLGVLITLYVGGWIIVAAVIHLSKVFRELVSRGRNRLRRVRVRI